MLLMAVTGVTLYYKSAILKWQYPALNLPAPVSMSNAARQLDTLPAALAAGYAYMPSQDNPWLEVVDKAGAHWYFGEQGHLLTRQQHGDVLSFFVSLHHDLMLGATGKDILGICGLLSLLLLITGIIRWWPRHRISLRLFTIHWFSLKSRKGLQTLAELHKVSAIIFAIPIIIIMLTGTAVIYSKKVNQALVATLPASDEQPEIPHPTPVAQTWQARLALAEQLFDDATPRLIYLSRARLRMKHADEWHPNGRNYVGFNPQNGLLTEYEDVRLTATGNQVSHAIYPLHASAVGGMIYLLISTITGLILILLPLTGIFYWVKRRHYASPNKRTWL